MSPANPLAQLTVVIPTRNRLALLRECLASVLSEAVSPRVVVVDDQSSDGTGEYLREIMSDRVVATSLPENVGRSRARNVGLSLVTTPYVMFLDDDDLLVGSAIASLTRCLMVRPAAIAAVGRGAIFDDRTGEEWDKFGPERPGVRDVFPELLSGWCPAQGQVVYRTDLLVSRGAWAAGMELLEDQELWLRLGAMGPVALLPILTVRIRRHEGQSRTSRDEQELVRIAEDLPQRAASVSRRPRAARRVLAARRRWDRAPMYEGTGRPWRALRDYLSIGVIAPELLASPVTGPAIRRDLRRAAGGALRLSH